MRPARALVVVLCAAAAACSPGAPPAGSDAGSGSGSNTGSNGTDGAVSGSRLKLTWYQFSDGSRQFDGLYDSERKEYCTPYDGNWPDGNNYCTPAETDQVVFSDAACSKPEADEYVGLSCNTDPIHYAIDTEYDACAGLWLPTHLYIKGTALQATTYYLPSSDGTCYQYDVQSYEQLYTVTSEVQTADLVRLALGPSAGSGALGVRSWVSSDGAQIPTQLHDPANDFDCTPDYYAADSTSATCAPIDAGDAYLDGNAACTEPAFAAAAGCSPPPYAYDYPTTECPTDLATYYATGAAVSGEIYEQFGATCESEGTDSTQAYYALGTQVPLTALQRAPDANPAYRLQVIHYGANQGLAYRDPTYLYDSQANTVCAPEQLSDGTIRCVPDSSYSVFGGFFYSDSLCKDALDVVDLYTGPASCGSPTLPSYVRKYIASNGCEENFELHQLTSKLTTLYYLVGTTCTKYTPDEEVIYGVGPAVATTDFLTATVTTDN